MTNKEEVTVKLYYGNVIERWDYNVKNFSVADGLVHYTTKDGTDVWSSLPFLWVKK